MWIHDIGNGLVGEEVWRDLGLEKFTNEHSVMLTTTPATSQGVQPRATTIQTSQVQDQSQT